MNVEWNVEHQIQSKFGFLDLNATEADTFEASLLRYQIMPTNYRIGPTLRVTQDNLSQFDGSDLHPRWLSGVTATLDVRYQQMRSMDTADYIDACGRELSRMDDKLRMWLNSMRTLTYADNQRLLWYGTGGENRMLLAVELLAIAEPSFTDTETVVSFALESPYPYAVDQAQKELSNIASGATFDVLNAGTADVYPVFQIHDVSGGTHTFTITNNVTGEEIVFDSSLPGGNPIGPSHYLEIDCFRGTAFTDGSGADNIAAISIPESDFFPIYALGGAPNSLSFTGGGTFGTCTLTILWNNAWA